MSMPPIIRIILFLHYYYIKNFLHYYSQNRSSGLICHIMEGTQIVRCIGPRMSYEVPFLFLSLIIATDYIINVLKR